MKQMESADAGYLSETNFHTVVVHQNAVGQTFCTLPLTFTVDLRFLAVGQCKGTLRQCPHDRGTTAKRSECVRPFDIEGLQ